MRFFLSNVIILLILSSIRLDAQSAETKLWDQLSKSYPDYKYEPISNRRFKHQDVVHRLNLLDDQFLVKTVGRSNGGRAIKLVSIGSGPIDVLLWSQMHGNEPTATMALMDVFNWLSDSKEASGSRNEVLSQLTIHFIPMLNPDGAQRFRRRNTQDIDINRDALRLQTPEGRTLKTVRDSLDAAWGFNLHDQGRTTAVSNQPATISFLAPAYDFDRNINEKRADAMQLIAAMNEQLQQEIPGQVGRYWDDFEPRAFGDNIQKWGTRTILIESGGQYRDREKQEIRKLNFLSITASLIWIANKSYEHYDVAEYETIPTNTRGIRDVILKNVSLPEGLGGYLTDFAIDFQEIENKSYDNYYLRARIVDNGDLSTSGGYWVHDMNGYQVKSGAMYNDQFESNAQLLAYGQLKLLKQGFTQVKIAKPDYFDKQVFLKVDKELDNQVVLGSNPGLLFYKNDLLKYVLVNGYLIDLSLTEKDIIKGVEGL